ncbi:hypothetical protein LJC11_04535, partial [Bacteroidales bacterium OttesenSCG-928-I21]|nr:hypothetical protein [Bacteroidales bacterium OttesenSCG-928-I21]
MAKWRCNPAEKEEQVCKFLSRRKFTATATSPICRDVSYDDRIFDYDYLFNHSTGNLARRTDKLRGSRPNEEIFTYDSKNRLTKSSQFVNGRYNADTIIYSNNGNIIRKSNVGNYEYESGKHSVHNITHRTENSRIDTDDQFISYNPLLKTQNLRQGRYYYEIFYGTDSQRKKTVLYEDNNVKKTKIYSGLYEKEITPEGTKELHYIPTPSGNVAVNIRYNGSRDTTYFLIRDHLGSIMKIVRPN